jgi:hypothetical protein
MILSVVRFWENLRLLVAEANEWIVPKIVSFFYPLSLGSTQIGTPEDD